MPREPHIISSINYVFLKIISSYNLQNIILIKTNFLTVFEMFIDTVNISFDHFFIFIVFINKYID